MPDRKIGMHPGVSMEEYLSWNALNASTLGYFAKSAKHAHHELTHPEPYKHHFEFGELVHKAILEPGKFDETYCKGPTGDRRTRKYKDALAKALEEHPGKIVAYGDDYDRAIAMRRSAWTTPIAEKILGGKGVNEISALANLGGQLCKIRVDRLTTLDGQTLVVNLKTTRDAEERSLGRDCANYLYHMGAAFYLDVLAEIQDHPRVYVTLAIEKTPPHVCVAYTLTDAAIEQGRDLYREYMARLTAAQTSNVWPGYADDGLMQLDLPPWAYKEVEYV